MIFGNGMDLLMRRTTPDAATTAETTETFKFEKQVIINVGTKN